MGTSLGDILSGLTSAGVGAETGIANRRELERQARMQLLAQRLQEAQIANYQSESQRRADQTRLEAARPRPGERLQHLVDPVTGQVYGYDPITNTVTPAAAGQTPGTPPPTTSTPPVKLHVKPTRPIAGTDAAGNTLLIDPTTGVASPVSGARKPLSPVERETKAAARTGKDLIKDMRALRRQSLTAGQLPLGTSIARAPTRLPIIGDAAKGVMEPIAQQFMTKEQAAYQQKADQLLHLASSVLPKGGRSIALLQNLRASFTSAALAKNPQAAEQALDELDKQLTEVLGEETPVHTGFQFIYHTPKRNE